MIVFGDVAGAVAGCVPAGPGSRGVDFRAASAVLRRVVYMYVRSDDALKRGQYYGNCDTVLPSAVCVCTLIMKERFEESATRVNFV